MFQIDQPTAAASLPTPAAAGTPGFFTDGNPGAGVPATIVDADFMNMIMMEMKNVVTAGGQTPSKSTYNQMLLAIENLIEARAGNYATDTGVANAYVIALSPAIAAYTNGLTVRFRVANANNNASTLDAGPGPVSLLNDVAGALVDGDLPLGAVVSASFDATANAFLINSLVPSQTLSQAQGDARYAQGMFPLSASVAANALTASLGACPLIFRNPSLTSGTPVDYTNAGSLSLTVPSTATLGTISGQAARLVFLVAYNGGTPVLCITNQAGGLQLDESNLISPTTISAGANSANVIYSASAVSANSPYRVVGFIDITEATAGTWATAPTTVQGCGGQALAALGSFGYGQQGQDLTASRAKATTYYNTTGKMIKIRVRFTSTAVAATAIAVNGLTYIGQAQSSVGLGIMGEMEVPAGAPYSADVSSGTGTLTSWIEFR